MFVVVWIGRVCLPVGKLLPVEGGVVVDVGDDESVTIIVLLDASGLVDKPVTVWVAVWVVVARIRLLLEAVDAVVFAVGGVGAQPHLVITIIVVPELEVYGELEQ